MDRIALRCVVAVFALLAASAAPPAFAQADPAYAPGRVIVKFRGLPPAGAALTLPGGGTATVVRRFRSGAEVVRVHGISVEDAVERYRSDPRVEYAEPDYIITVDQAAQNLPDDPRFLEQYNLNNTGQTGGTAGADIDAPEAWTISTGGDVLVGVIDTGIDYTHEDLAANVWVNPGEIPDNHVDDDGNGFVDDVHGWDFVNHDSDPMDDHHHGTHVAGIIAAVGNNGIGVTGVCWKARLMAIKILNGNGQGVMSDAIAGIEYASLMGVRIANNSWGTPVHSRALEDAVAALAQTDMVFVAAAGNDGQSNELFPHYPSSLKYDNIIAVANSDDDDALSVTSNYGAESVDLAAPGEFILSLYPHNEYELLSGTSMATPHVSGAVALILSEAPLMTVAQVKALLLSTVDVVPALQGKILSGGRLNAYRALAALDAVQPGRVRDLRVADRGSNTVTLAWTASGDDADVGTAALYDIRYADTPIKPSNFDRAVRVEGVPAPLAPGTRQSVRVDGLEVKVTYFFAMRVLDERLNASEVSNVVAGRTWSAPEVSFSPGQFDGAALTGAAVTRTLNIANTGKGTIDFDVAPGAAGWARAEPARGTVRARDTAEISVTLDALGLAGGEYDDALTLITNDPGIPSVALSVHLAVASAPHVVVSADSVDFGGWFVGAQATRELVVQNRGDRTLTVTGIAVVEAGSAFDATATPFTLPPAAEKTIAVQFAPSAVGDVSAQLRVASDDPDDGELTVALAGRGLPPPDIRVVPGTVAATIHTGAAAKQVLTVVNDGTSDLVWNLSTDADTTAPDPAGGSGGEGPFRDLTGVRILYDAAHYNLHWFNYNTMFIDLRGRGAEVVVSRPPFTRDYLDGFDVVWMADAFEPLTSDERAALVAWVRAGGGLLLEGDYDVTIPVFRGILQGLLSGIELSFDDGATGITEFIEPHETTRGVTNMFLSFVKATLSSVRPPAHPLVYDVDGVCNTAWSRAGAGRLIVMGDQNLSNNRMGQTGNQTFGNRAIDWLAEGVSWLGASPTSGVIPPSQSQDVEVSINAAGLGGGFDARIVVRSNDPETPVLVRPVRLDATPAPDIVVSAPNVAFPHTELGETSRVDMWVGNIGVADLSVRNVSVSSPEFAAAPTAFAVAPGEFVTLSLSFAPAGTGGHDAVLTIESDDPDADSTGVALSVQPDSAASVEFGKVAAGTAAFHAAAEVAPRIPARTALHPNIPNPFNPTTTIPYDVHEIARVTIVIYDVHGRAVRTLVDRVRAPGRYGPRWDGTDERGTVMASGIYFVRMVAGRISQTQKIVLLK